MQTKLEQLSAFSRPPDELFLHQGETPEGPEIQLEELDKRLQRFFSFTVPLEQSFATSFAFFPTLCKPEKSF